jgi:thiamine-phosphate pyrophosphorylase
VVDATLAPKAEALRYRLYTLEKAVGIGATSTQLLAGVTLCVLLDGRRSTEEFEALAMQLIEARVGMIQLRDKSLEDRDLLARARLLVSLTRRHHLKNNQPPAPPGVAPLNHTLAIINDRADIAAAARTDGVHLGQEDLSVKDARAIGGPQLLIGVSTHNIDQARAAVLDGANYLGAGPTFPSKTKSFNAFAGIDYLRQVATEIRLPTFAIGGISAENLAQVIDVGIARVAVSSAVTTAHKPPSAARELLDMLTANPPRQSDHPAKVQT